MFRYTRSVNALVEHILIYSGSALLVRIALWLVLMLMIGVAVFKTESRKDFKGLAGWLIMLTMIAAGLLELYFYIY